MSTFSELQMEHEQLLARLEAVENPDQLAGAAKHYLREVQRSSSEIAVPYQRAQLQANLRFWATFIYDQEKIYPRIVLQDPSQEAKDKAGKAPLTVRLQERRHLRLLGEAIDEAETLQAIGQLQDGQILSLLSDAKAYFDAQYSTHYEILFDLRNGGLAERFAARGRIQDLIRQGEQELFDSASGTWRLSGDVLEEANAVYDRASSEEAQLVLSAVESLQSAHPKDAVQRLKGTLDQPFLDRDKQILDHKLFEARSLAQVKEQAQRLVDKAEETQDPHRQLELLRQAKDLFPRLDGLPARLRAAEQLAHGSRLLDEARIALAHGQWQRVIEIAENALTSLEPEASSVRAEAEEFLKDAAQETDIAHAHQLIREGEIAKADDILNGVLARAGAPGHLVALRERLKPDLETVAQAIKDTPPMQALFERAEVLSSQESIQDRLGAWRLFGIVGGNSSVPRRVGEEEFRLSLYTAAARWRARDLESQMQQEVSDLLMEASTARQYRHFDFFASETLVETTKAVRETGFPETEVMREAIDWVEQAGRIRIASGLEQRGDWEQALALWESLFQDLPDVPEIRLGLTQARVRQILAWVGLYQPEEAKDYVEAAQREMRSLPSWEIPLALARAYAELFDLVKAQELLKLSERYLEFAPGERQSLAHPNVRIMRSALETLQAAEQHRQRKQYKEALLVLQGDSQQSVSWVSSLLNKFRERIVEEAESHLRDTLPGESESKSADGLLQRVTVWLNLMELEEIAGKEHDAARFYRELDALRGPLTSMWDGVLWEAKRLNISGWTLDQALQEVRRLDGLLRTFARLDAFVDYRSEQDQSVQYITTRVSQMLAQLHNLEALVQEAQPLWDEAVRHGDFWRLEGVLERMQQLQLEKLVDIQQFELRLSEWKDMCTFLSSAIDEIQKKFLGEDFRQVRSQLDELRLCPLRQPNQQEYQQIHLAEYEHIRRLMSDRLRIPDRYTDKPERVLIGWEAVRKAARERDHELERWRILRDRVQVHRHSIEEAIRKISRSEGIVPSLREQRHGLQQIQTQAAAIVAIVAPAILDDETSLALNSAYAKVAYEQLASWHQYAAALLRGTESRLIELERELNDPKNRMPDRREYEKSLKLARHGEVSRLQECLARARRVGPETEKEKVLVETYTSLLEGLRDGRGSARRGLLGRILGFFNR